MNGGEIKLDTIFSRQLTTSLQSLAGDRQEALHASTTVMELIFDDWGEADF